MDRALSVKLTEYRTLSFSMSVNSPYNTPTGPFRWRDGSGSDASFSIPDGESAARPAGRCADGGALRTVSLCLLAVGLFECLTASFLVQSLSLVTETRNGSDGGVSLRSPRNTFARLL